MSISRTARTSMLPPSALRQVSTQLNGCGSPRITVRVEEEAAAAAAAVPAAAGESEGVEVEPRADCRNVVASCAPQLKPMLTGRTKSTGTSKSLLTGALGREVNPTVMISRSQNSQGLAAQRGGGVER
jgi:hypothetical protein